MIFLSFTVSFKMSLQSACISSYIITIVTFLWSRFIICLSDCLNNTFVVSKILIHVNRVTCVIPCDGCLSLCRNQTCGPGGWKWKWISVFWSTLQIQLSRKQKCPKNASSSALIKKTGPLFGQHFQNIGNQAISLSVQSLPHIHSQLIVTTF